jgi:hypothetical protein
MSNKQTKKLSAPQLRLALIGLIVFLIGLSAVGFWFFREQLITYANTVNQSSAAASSSSEDISKLQRLKQELSDDKVAVTRAKSIVADSQYYQYQDQIIEDINAYAKSAGVTVTGFTFNNEGATGSVASPASPATVGAAPVPVGLKTTSVIITVKNPVKYQAIMNFLHSIELNLTRMEITGISIAKATADNSAVTVNPINIEVYTR